LVHTGGFVWCWNLLAQGLAALIVGLVTVPGTGACTWGLDGERGCTRGVAGVLGCCGYGGITCGTRGSGTLSNLDSSPGS